MDVFGSLEIFYQIIFTEKKIIIAFDSLIKCANFVSCTSKTAKRLVFKSLLNFTSYYIFSNKKSN